jgi:hypothetical protein
VNNNEIHNLTSDQAKYLAETEFPSETTIKVINVYKVEGSSFSKFFNFTDKWSKPMQVIETNLGWFVDTTIESQGATYWNQKTYSNCKITYFKSKYKPLWLQKDRDESRDIFERELNLDLM